MKVQIAHLISYFLWSFIPGLWSTSSIRLSISVQKLVNNIQEFWKVIGTKLCAVMQLICSMESMLPSKVVILTTGPISLQQQSSNYGGSQRTPRKIIRIIQNKDINTHTKYIIHTQNALNTHEIKVLTQTMITGACKVG